MRTTGQHEKGEMSISGNIYIAVIDDESTLRTSLSRLLRLADFQPISYPSAEAFLSDSKHPKFDCMVLDIRLTGMSGIDLFRRLRAESKRSLPVIFITAFDDPETHAEAVALGCSGYFRKTDPGSNIIEAIRQAIQTKDTVTSGRYR